MKKRHLFCGKIVIVGKTNVGKSTLFNKLMEKKISIECYKPNTTQDFIIGINTVKQDQFIYIDTPGIHKTNKTDFIKINQIFNTSNLILFVLENIKWTNDDDKILKKIKKYNIPILLIFNKIDKLHNKNFLLPHIKLLSNKFNFFKYIPMSAKESTDIKNLSIIIKKLLPIAPHQYEKNYFTNCSLNFLISELIRKQFLYNFHKELPYLLTIKISSIKINIFGKYIIQGIVYITDKKHKKIFIGSKGEKIKLCSLLARKEIENFLHKQVSLFLWIKQNKNY
ncbi:GTPase Era [Buchnera aphidicola (Hormaphis cornu)]|nr:GTPase Era [Buchnera aphidicola (Hormaphis cornu)]